MTGLFAKCFRLLYTLHPRTQVRTLDELLYDLHEICHQGGVPPGWVTALGLVNILQARNIENMPGRVEHYRTREAERQWLVKMLDNEMTECAAVRRHSRVHHCYLQASPEYCDVYLVLRPGPRGGTYRQWRIRLNYADIIPLTTTLRVFNAILVRAGV